MNKKCTCICNMLISFLKYYKWRYLSNLVLKDLTFLPSPPKKRLILMEIKLSWVKIFNPSSPSFHFPPYMQCLCIMHFMCMCVWLGAHLYVCTNLSTCVCPCYVFLVYFKHWKYALVLNIQFPLVPYICGVCNFIIIAFKACLDYRLWMLVSFLITFLFLIKLY